MKNPKNVVVVATHPELALAEYDRYSVYMCPAPYVQTEDGEWISSGYAKSSFWDCSHFAFYYANQIYPKIPKIQARIESVGLGHEWIEEVTTDDVKTQDLELVKQRLHTLVSQLENDKNPPSTTRLDYLHQVFFLSKPNEEETVDLGDPIINNKLGKGGKITAFTQRFCYVSLPSLQNAKFTTDIK